MTVYHDPVLLHESVEGLAVRAEGIYVDATFGGGGHSREILNRLGSGGRLIAFDRDGDSARNKITDERFTLINHNFKFLKNYLKYYKVHAVDGILADLGISSWQIDNPGRGFSSRFDGRLDLRMDTRKKNTGADIVNTMDARQLARIFKQYGELENAGAISDVIIRRRAESPIITTTDLKETLQKLCPARLQSKFMARVFQALRIEVNQELEALQNLLEQSLEMLAPEGRLVVISYHSLEDKLVKNFMRSGNLSGTEDKDPIYGSVKTPFRLITKKPVGAGSDEISLNNRARSARLRIAEKI